MDLKTKPITATSAATSSRVDKYREARKASELICRPLATEDYVVQPVVDVSPPKWHLGHTAWFFETFLLKPHFKNYSEFNPDYNYVFNSYYETIGARVIRTNRGNLSRPTVEDVYDYRRHVDQAMIEFLSSPLKAELEEVFLLGLNHEQQHQELLYTDIKYILGHNPLFPAYNKNGIEEVDPETNREFITIDEGIYSIGFEGEGFCFDNELNRHKVYLQEYSIASSLVTNGEYLEFINDGGYKDFRHWHTEGWEWVKSRQVRSPLYWHHIDGRWQHYTLKGLQDLDPAQPLTHINFYEASAFAQWKGMRLPTEAEWEVAADQFKWGHRWEWTNSAYLPYPGYTKAEGAIGEYNGKFMVNQWVLRGASVATPRNHRRISYRNFFQTDLQWQFTGIRLAK
jgi:ergothioneine biosynthesis protein EgtB